MTTPQTYAQFSHPALKNLSDDEISKFNALPPEVQEFFAGEENQDIRYGAPNDITKQGCFELALLSNEHFGKNRSYELWNAWRKSFEVRYEMGVKLNFANFESLSFSKYYMGRALLLNFAHFDFGDGADFSSVVFEHAGAFETKLRFNRAIFGNESSFSKARFNCEVEFMGAIFEGDINFSGASFEDSVCFDNAKFYRHSDFNGTQFYENVCFDNAKWFNPESGATFNGTQFGDRASFIDSQFFGYADFRAQSLDDLVYFFGNEYLKETLNKSKLFGEGEGFQIFSHTLSKIGVFCLFKRRFRALSPAFTPC